MEDHTDNRQLIVSLTKDHPIFFFNEQQRNQIVKELLEHYSPSQRVEKELAQLNAKVDSLTAKLELVNDVFETVMAIKKSLEMSGENRQLTVQVEKVNERLPEQASEEAFGGQTKRVKFDVDAFLSLG